MSHILSDIGWQLRCGNIRRLRMTCHHAPRTRPCCRYYRTCVTVYDVGSGVVIAACTQLDKLYDMQMKRRSYAILGICECGTRNLILTTDTKNRTQRIAYIECCSLSPCMQEYVDIWNNVSRMYGYHYLNNQLTLHKNDELVFEKQFCAN